MKRAKKLTYQERKIVNSWGKNSDNWEKIKEYTQEHRMLLRNVLTGELIEIPNYKKGERI